MGDQGELGWWIGADYLLSRSLRGGPGYFDQYGPGENGGGQLVSLMIGPSMRTGSGNDWAPGKFNGARPSQVWSTRLGINGREEKIWLLKPKTAKLYFPKYNGQEDPSGWFA
ncbi:unnamed protein product [Linum trigynum]|uniref:Uncharacterized protein n=1 Tax=Linum trigynum TaxID=586398 RepID=A0AAV2EUV5_9ROSI